VSPDLTLLVTVAVLYSSGVYLLLERSLTRVLLGVLLIGNATNLLLLSTAGESGGPPIIGATDDARTSDPLPQAMVLTAIVITLGITAFVLALLHRGWSIARNDELVDDEADRTLRTSAAEEEDALQPGEPEYDSGDDRPWEPQP